MARVMMHILPIDTQYLLRTYSDTLVYILFVIAYDIVPNSFMIRMWMLYFDLY